MATYFACLVAVLTHFHQFAPRQTCTAHPILGDDPGRWLPQRGRHPIAQIAQQSTKPEQDNLKSTAHPCQTFPHSPCACAKIVLRASDTSFSAIASRDTSPQSMSCHPRHIPRFSLFLFKFQGLKDAVASFFLTQKRGPLTTYLPSSRGVLRKKVQSKPLMVSVAE